MNKKKIYLYYTEACHLCELAKDVLASVQTNESAIWGSSELTLVDISEKDELFEKYGVRIPVVKKEGVEQDIGWPFTEQDLVRYLESN